MEMASPVGAPGSDTAPDANGADMAGAICVSWATAEMIWAAVTPALVTAGKSRGAPLDMTAPCDAVEALGIRSESRESVATAEPCASRAICIKVAASTVEFGAASDSLDISDVP